MLRLCEHENIGFVVHSLSGAYWHDFGFSDFGDRSNYIPINLSEDKHVRMICIYNGTSWYEDKVGLESVWWAILQWLSELRAAIMQLGSPDALPAFIKNSTNPQCNIIHDVAEFNLVINLRKLPSFFGLVPKHGHFRM